MLDPIRLRGMISFRYSPLLDMALSLLVIQNPERFGSAAPWEQRVLDRLPAGLVDELREHGRQVDLFGLAMDLEEGPPMATPDALRSVGQRNPDLAKALLTYWEAVSPEIGAKVGLLSQSIQLEMNHLGQMDPLAFISRFSDRVSVAGDGEAIILHWGKGMRIPLDDLKRILFVPSAFIPRRLMFYRLGDVQIFFYDPLHEASTEVEMAPESLVVGFSALSDPTRLKILRLIALEQLPAQEMAQRLGVTESTISRHIRLLAEAGFIGRGRQEGKFIRYELQPERIDELAAMAKTYLRRDRR